MKAERKALDIFCTFFAWPAGFFMAVLWRLSAEASLGPQNHSDPQPQGLWQSPGWEPSGEKIAWHLLKWGQEGPSEG